MRPTPWTPLAAALAVIVGAATASGVELAGTWYVLVHYKDEGSGNPEQERWEDKVWVFEHRGGQLRWIEYPIVVFDDETGRFQRNAAGKYARIPHFWQPNPAQRADVADGLQVNPRSSKHKRLRGSREKGWSSERSSAAASASVLLYSEVWSIDGVPELPVFSRTDFLSGARADSVGGLTRHATTAIRERGDLLVGTFERDGSRHGSFRMMRCGAVQLLKGRGRQAERQRVRSQPTPEPATPQQTPSEVLP